MCPICCNHHHHHSSRCSELWSRKMESDCLSDSHQAMSIDVTFTWYLQVSEQNKTTTYFTQHLYQISFFAADFNEVIYLQRGRLIITRLTNAANRNWIQKERSRIELTQKMRRETNSIKLRPFRHNYYYYYYYYCMETELEVKSHFELPKTKFSLVALVRQSLSQSW